MAEGSRFWTTNNTGDGPTAGYSAANFNQFVRETFITDPTTEGVMYGVGNALAVSGTSSPVAVNTGAAIVYGFYYYNDASLNVTVSTPASATRIDRIVLRVSWAAQTVRVTRIAGVEGSGVAPAMTQTANTTWDIPLATVSITTGGVITVTDARTYLKHPGVYGWLDEAFSVNGTITGTTSVNASSSVSGGTVDLTATNTATAASSQARLVVSVNGASAGDALAVFHQGTNSWALGLDNSDSDKFKIAAGFEIGGADKFTLDSSGNLTLTGAFSAPGGISASQLLSGTVPLAALSGITTSQLSASAGILDAQIAAVDAAKLTSGTLPLARLSGITTGNLAADSVDDTIVGNRVPQFYRRQGGSATDWNSTGTTTYTPGAVRMQAGVASVAVTSGTGGATITFPTAFSQPPIVVATCNGTLNVAAQVGAVTASTFYLSLSAASGTATWIANWIAIGPE